MINLFKRPSALRCKAKFIHKLINIELTSLASKPTVNEIEQCLRTYYLAAMGINHHRVSQSEQLERIELAINKKQPWLKTYDGLALSVLFKKCGIKSVHVRKEVLNNLDAYFQCRGEFSQLKTSITPCDNTVQNLQIDNAGVAGVVYGDSMANLYREAVDLNLDDLCNGQGSIWLLKDLDANGLSQFMKQRGVPDRDIIIISDAAPSKGYSFLPPISDYHATPSSMEEIVVRIMCEKGLADANRDTDGYHVLRCTLRHVFKLAIEKNEPTLLDFPALADFIKIAEKHNVDISLCLGEAFGIDPELILPDFEPTEDHYNQWGLGYVWVFDILKQLRPILRLGDRSIYDAALGLNGEEPKHFIIDFNSPLAQYAATILLQTERYNRCCNKREVEQAKGKRCPVFIDPKMIVNGVYSVPNQFNTKFFAIHTFYGNDFKEFEFSTEEFKSAIANVNDYVISSLNSGSHYDNEILRFLRSKGEFENDQLFICKGE